MNHPYFEEDWADSVLPQELYILSKLPEDKRQTVFEEAAEQNHCPTLREWLNFLENYVDGYIRLNQAE